MTPERAQQVVSASAIIMVEAHQKLPGDAEEMVDGVRKLLKLDEESLPSLRMIYLLGLNKGLGKL